MWRKLKDLLSLIVLLACGVLLVMYMVEHRNLARMLSESKYSSVDTVFYLSDSTQARVVERIESSIKRIKNSQDSTNKALYEKIKMLGVNNPSGATVINTVTHTFIRDSLIQIQDTTSGIFRIEAKEGNVEVTGVVNCMNRDYELNIDYERTTYVIDYKQPRPRPFKIKYLFQKRKRSIIVNTDDPDTYIEGVVSYKKL